MSNICCRCNTLNVIPRFSLSFFSVQFQCSADHMKKVYGKFCSRHNEAVNHYKETLAKDKRFQAFIKVCTRPSTATVVLTYTYSQNFTLRWLLCIFCLCRRQWAAALCAGSVFLSAFCWSLRGSPNILFWSRGSSSILKVRMNGRWSAPLFTLLLICKHKHSDGGDAMMLA